MKVGNASEQLEAALVESLIQAVAEGQNASEVSRSYEISDDGTLVVNSVLKANKPVDHVKIDLKIL